MTFALFSDVRETSVSTGTGDMVLGGAYDLTYFTFAHRYSDGDTFWYGIKSASGREVGLGTYNAGANSITRTTVFESTNADAAVSFLAGTKDVYVALPGPQYGVRLQKAVTAAGDVTIADNTGADVIKINNTSGGAINVFLPSAAVRKKRIRIVDVGAAGAGNAAANNITVKPKAASGQTVMGSATGYVIDSNGGSIELEPNSDGTGYF